MSTGKRATQTLIEMAFELDRLAVRCEDIQDFTVQELRLQLQRMSANVAELARKKGQSAA